MMGVYGSPLIFVCPLESLDYNGFFEYNGDRREKSRLLGDEKNIHTLWDGIVWLKFKQDLQTV